MARAFVLIKYPGKLSEAFACIERIRNEPDNLLRRRTIIESHQFAFGSADVCVLLYAATWGDVAVGVQYIRQELDLNLPEQGPKTLTNTLLGLGKHIVMEPVAEGTRAINRLINIARATRADHDHVAAEALAQEYLADRLESIRTVIEHMHAANALSRITATDLTMLEGLQRKLEADP